MLLLFRGWESWVVILLLLLYCIVIGKKYYWYGCVVRVLVWCCDGVLSML